MIVDLANVKIEDLRLAYKNTEEALADEGLSAEDRSYLDLVNEIFWKELNKRGVYLI